MKDDIEKYLTGAMSPEEMHALEKRALHDPFLEEALDGAQSITFKEFTSDVSALKKRFSDKEKISNPWIIPFRIAATVTLLVVGSFAIYTFLQPTEQIASTEKTQEQKPISLDANKSPVADSALHEKSKENLLSLNKPAPSATSAGAKNRDQIKPTLQPPAPVLDEVTSGEKDASGPAGETIAAAEPAQIEDLSDAKREETKVAEAEVQLQNSERSFSGKKAKSAPAKEENAKISDDSAQQLASGGASGSSFHLDLSTPSDSSRMNEIVVMSYGKNDSDTRHRGAIELAEPGGGKKSYQNYLEKNLRYPAAAIQNKEAGKVTVEFSVHPDGSLTNFIIIDSLDFGCNEEVIRLVKEGPGWKPSSQASIPTKSTVRVQVKFKLPK